MIPLHDDNPTQITPWVTYSLLAACALAFVWQIGAGTDPEALLDDFGFVPARLLDSPAYNADAYALPAAMTLITYQFLHGGVLHLAGNLLYLWIFGNNVEEAAGHVRFLIFYLLCGVAAALGQGYITPASDIPMVGASGAISGVLGAYILLYPQARILVVIPLGFIFYPARITAIWVLGIWFAMQAIAAVLSDPDTPGIAWWAHFAGFVSGLALILVMRRPGVRLFGKARELPKGPWARVLAERGRNADEPRGRL